jgi:xylan 1,4-beta-xylosidase
MSLNFCSSAVIIFLQKLRTVKVLQLTYMKYLFTTRALPGIFCSLVLVISILSCTDSSSQHNAETSAEAAEESGNNPVYLADPTIFFHDGTYYLYGTSGHDSNLGFEVYTSKDMEDWEGPKGANNGLALRKEDVFGDKGFWAPQIFYYNDQFYMAYTANENIAIATADNPLGPFTQKDKVSLEAPVKQIDPFTLIDDDGKKYLYHVRLSEGNRLFVAEMTDDFSSIKPETLQECIAAEEPWENTQNVAWPVAEGPSILKHQGLYYFVYSTNDFRNPDYAVGYAVSNNPYGPWEKYAGNPILSREDVGENGTGHGDFTTDRQGNLYYVLHTHYSDSTVSPRRTALVKARFAEPEADGEPDRLVMDEESFYFLQSGN